jgi:hypothetical protein
MQGVREERIVLTCAQCGAKFEGQRSTAKRCSARCRKRAERGLAPAKGAQDE